MERLITVGIIAEELGCPVWQVQYLLQSRRIEPTQRAGHLRIFSEDVIEVLRAELTALNNRKGTRVCTV